MDIRVDRNLETYKCYTFLEMGNDEGYVNKANLRISFTPKVVIESLCYVITLKFGSYCDMCSIL